MEGKAMAAGRPRRLGQVDLPVEPVDHVEIIAGEFRVDQRLVGAAGPDLPEQAGGTLQPFGNLMPA